MTYVIVNKRTKKRVKKDGVTIPAFEHRVQAFLYLKNRLNDSQYLEIIKVK